MECSSRVDQRGVLAVHPLLLLAQPVDAEPHHVAGHRTMGKGLAACKRRRQAYHARSQLLTAASAGAPRAGLRPVRRLAMLGLLLRGAFGQLGDADQVLGLACVRLNVRLRRPFGARRIKVATDGEICWLTLPLEFVVSPEPLWLIRPATPAPERAAP